MPTFYKEIPSHISTWALAQPVFFTASAPLSGRHVNLSPKGLPRATFTIFTPTSAAYIDCTGSGAETIAHVYENGRLTVMFCSFGPNPRILRFFCTARVVEWDRPAYPALVRRMGKEDVEGARAVVLLDVWKVQTSCGFGVPTISALPAKPAGPFPNAADPIPVSSTPDLLPSSPPPEFPSAAAPFVPTPMPFADRPTLARWAHSQCSSNKMRAYQSVWNAHSLDGCPALRAARRDRGEWLLPGDLRAWAVRVGRGQWEGVVVGLVVGLILVWILGLAGWDGERRVLMR